MITGFIFDHILSLKLWSLIDEQAGFTRVEGNQHDD